MKEVKLYSLWRHHKGKEVVVVGFSRDGNSAARRILYVHREDFQENQQQGHGLNKDAVIWDHLESDWFRVEENGTPRFSPA